MKIKSTFAAAIASLTTVIGATPSFATDWVYIGEASSGEAVYVALDSKGQGRGGEQGVVAFLYRLDDEEFYALGNCETNEWYVEDYGTYSPDSEATQAMLDYVCE